MGIFRPTVAGVILEVEPGIFVLAKGPIHTCNIEVRSDIVKIDSLSGYRELHNTGRRTGRLDLLMEIEELHTVNRNFFENDKAIGEQKKLPE